MKRIVLTLTLIALLASACGGASSAGVCNDRQMRAYNEAIHEIRVEFEDAFSLAEATPRDDLGDRIAQMQDIRRAAQSAEIPACAAEGHAYLVDYMDYSIDFFLAFQAYEEEDETYEIMQNIANSLTRYTEFARDPANLDTSPLPTPMPFCLIESLDIESGMPNGGIVVEHTGVGVVEVIDYATETFETPNSVNPGNNGVTVYQYADLLGKYLVAVVNENEEILLTEDVELNNGEVAHYTLNCDYH